VGPPDDESGGLRRSPPSNAEGAPFFRQGRSRQVVAASHRLFKGWIWVSRVWGWPSSTGSLARQAKVRAAEVRAEADRLVQAQADSVSAFAERFAKLFERAYSEYAAATSALGSHFANNRIVYGDRPPFALDPLPVTFWSLLQRCHRPMERDWIQWGQLTPAALADAIPAARDEPLEFAGSNVQRSEGRTRSKTGPGSRAALTACVATTSRHPSRGGSSGACSLGRPKRFTTSRTFQPPVRAIWRQQPESVRGGDAVGGAVTPPTAFQSVSESHTTRVEQLRSSRCCRSVCRSLPLFAADIAMA
jgi:hypothetical protein